MTVRRLVAALGGNALAGVERDDARRAARAIAALAAEHALVVTHGNGPQVGWLASAVGEGVPLDVVGAGSDGMLGYLLGQELANALPGRSVATLLTQTVVDPGDPAFRAPTKPIGPPRADGTRRRVASPRPQGLVELEAIRLLVGHGVIVICAGGGGVPVAVGPHGALRGIEAVIDKDAASAWLAAALGAEVLLLLTDVACVYEDWPGRERPIRRATAGELAGRSFEAGSMGPKVEAAVAFARGGGLAAIGRLDDALAVLRGEAGTRVEGP